MAKKVENTEKEEVKMINVKALVYLKYNKNSYKTGDEFQINEDDLEEMGERELIGPGKEVSEEVPKEFTPAVPEELGADTIPVKEGE